MFISSLHTLLPKLSYTAINLDFDQQAVTDGLPYATSGDANTAFGRLITQVLNIVLTIGVIALLFFLILGAFEWITAGGDSGKIQKAREKMTGAVIGLIIMVSIVAIMMFIQQLLGICIIDFGGIGSSC